MAATAFNQPQSNWSCTNDVPNTSICIGSASRWKGIKCLEGNITEISLPQESLKGTLPTTLGLIKSLVMIILSNNTLYGTIPTSLGDLSSLKTLDLKSNQFSGKLPATLCELSLTTLSLSHNNFSCYPSCYTSISDFEYDARISACSSG